VAQGIDRRQIGSLARNGRRPVVLNETQPATFLLDTGASTTVITPDLARRLGAETSFMTARARMANGQEVDVSLVHIKSIRIGSATVDNPAWQCTNSPRRFTMTLDPRAGTLTIQSAEPTARLRSAQPNLSALWGRRYSPGAGQRAREEPYAPQSDVGFR
jgi:aspartyl protease